MDARHTKIDEADAVPTETRLERIARLRNDPNREARWAKWREENSEAIAASNAWYEKNGHPLAAYMIKPGDPLPR